MRGLHGVQRTDGRGATRGTLQARSLIFGSPGLPGEGVQPLSKGLTVPPAHPCPPGLLWQLRPSDVEVELLAHTRRVVSRDLEDETGLHTGWIQNGGLFIASSRQRLDEYKRLMSLGKVYGIESHVLSPGETKALYPLMNVEDLYGTLYVPHDGTMDPAGTCTSLARAATARGAQVIENCPVTGIRVRTDDFGVRRVAAVETEFGCIQTPCVVNCAGVWAGAVGRMAGVKVPLVAMHHAYVVTERIEGIQNMPNVRDHDASVYLRLQGDALSVGGYETNPIFWEEPLRTWHAGRYRRGAGGGLASKQQKSEGAEYTVGTPADDEGVPGLLSGQLLGFIQTQHPSPHPQPPQPRDRRKLVGGSRLPRAPSHASSRPPRVSPAGGPLGPSPRLNSALQLSPGLLGCRTRDPDSSASECPSWGLPQMFKVLCRGHSELGGERGPLRDRAWGRVVLGYVWHGSGLAGAPRHHWRLIWARGRLLPLAGQTQGGGEGALTGVTALLGDPTQEHVAGRDPQAPRSLSESFTPDHKPLMGEAPELRGFFLGCGFNSAGMMLGGGCGQQLASWIVHGRPEKDMHSYDIRRFHRSLTDHSRWIRERSHEAYAKNYSVVFPHDEPLAGRNMRTDPLHEVPQPHTPPLGWLRHSRGVLGVGRQRARGTPAAGHMRYRGGWFAPGI
nr:sarcosine dehydrogenase, mitochondrial-like [Odocoileus virginianus texanus]